jgi:hypothetical protein
MPKPDFDMRRISDLFAEARAIANRREWPTISHAIDCAQTALLKVEPYNGEKRRVEYRPTFEIWESETDE